MRKQSLRIKGAKRTMVLNRRWRLRGAHAKQKADCKALQKRSQSSFKIYSQTWRIHDAGHDPSGARGSGHAHHARHPPQGRDRGEGGGAGAGARVGAQGASL